MVLLASSANYLNEGRSCDCQSTNLNSMKQRVTLILITFFILGVVQRTFAQSWKGFKGTNYAIKYPDTWSLDTSKGMGTAFIIFSQLENDSDKFRENVNMIVQDLTAQNINLDDYVKISEKQIKGFMTEGKIYESERLKAGQGEYQKIIFSGTQGAFHLKFEQYYFVKNKNAYVVTLTAAADKFDYYKPTGEQILKSFILN